MLGVIGDRRTVVRGLGDARKGATGQARVFTVHCGRAAVLAAAAPALVLISWAVTALGAHSRAPWQWLRASPLEAMDEAMMSLALTGSPDVAVANANARAAATAESHRMLALTFASAFIAVVAIVVFLLGMSRLAKKPALRTR